MQSLGQIKITRQDVRCVRYFIANLKHGGSIAEQLDTDTMSLDERQRLANFVQFREEAADALTYCIKIKYPLYLVPSLPVKQLNNQDLFRYILRRDQRVIHRLSACLRKIASTELQHVLSFWLAKWQLELDEGKSLKLAGD